MFVVFVGTFCWTACSIHKWISSTYWRMEVLFISTFLWKHNHIKQLCCFVSLVQWKHPHYAQDAPAYFVILGQRHLDMFVFYALLLANSLKYRLGSIPVEMISSQKRLCQCLFIGNSDALGSRLVHNEYHASSPRFTKVHPPTPQVEKPALM